MSVALYLEECPGYPVTRVVPCPCGGGNFVCVYCRDTPGKQTTQDWGPCKSANFTASTMGATLEKLGISTGNDSLGIEWYSSMRSLVAALTTDTGGFHLPQLRCYGEIVRFVARALLHPGVTLESKVYCA